MDTITGTKLGPYKLTRRLARGGMSEIYVAYHEKSEQMCALKVVHWEDEEYWQRFQREIETLQQLDHPNIIRILDYGKQNNICYYAMPYIAQGSLKERIATGPLGLDEVGTILEQIANALQFLHARDFVHRDVKPGNILLDETNHAWLADFGLAKKLEGALDLTATGCLIGTPHYMAPELVNKPAATSSDIYALSVVVYEMLTGKVPFTGRTPVTICWKHVHEQPPLPSTFNPLIFPVLEQVILRALAKKPQARFATAQELTSAYFRALTYPEDFSAGEQLCLPCSDTVSITIKPARTSEMMHKRRRRARPLAAAAAAAVALFTLGVGLAGLTNAGQSSTPLLPNAVVQARSAGQATSAETASPTREVAPPVHMVHTPSRHFKHPRHHPHHHSHRDKND
ncbi:MAG TPA: serine/threonine-protein kinase [Ktedonobacteraceae bacterium]|nr:serine/threonine-protein kinase [Ktedonobacteraceae bacterium]